MGSTRDLNQRHYGKHHQRLGRHQHKQWQGRSLTEDSQHQGDAQRDETAVTAAKRKYTGLPGTITENKARHGKCHSEKPQRTSVVAQQITPGQDVGQIDLGHGVEQQQRNCDVEHIDRNAVDSRLVQQPDTAGYIATDHDAKDGGNDSNDHISHV